MLNVPRTMQLAMRALLCVALSTQALHALATPYVGNVFSIPGALDTTLWDISDSGQIVGGVYDGVRQYGFIYDSGQLTRLDGPNGAIGVVGVIGISNNGIAIGSWVDAQFQQHSFVYQQGQYTVTDLKVDDLSAIVRGISPDGRYLTGYFGGSNGSNTKGFVYDMGSAQLLARIEAPGSLLAQGINSYGQVVGSYSGRSFLYDVGTGTRTDFGFAGMAAVSARAINDQGQIAGWLFASGEPEIRHAWIGSSSGYQILDLGLGPQGEYGQGINNLGQVVGFLNASMSSGVIASPVILPQAPEADSDPHTYSFSTAVVADLPVFLDPLVAVGYVYKTGAGDPLFKTVSLPAGVGDNRFELVVDGQHFMLYGNQIFDFTAHGFDAGVAEFSVQGIEAELMLDPTDSQAFVTRVTFVGSGMFTGTQSALTQDYTAPVPEPATGLMILAGGLALWGRHKTGWTRTKHGCESANP